jgi:type II secretory pathway component PulJ
MIKLKKLIKESAWDRKFGEPLPTLKDVVEKHQREEKQELNEGIDLHSHVVLVKSQLDRFKKDLNDKRGGSFDSDSYEYEEDRWKNNSKMLKSRDKKLGQWEKKVNKALNGLIKDYVKAWK